MTKYYINTDGGARGNPGPAAIGIVMKNEAGECVCEISKYIGEKTNNQAEYAAVVEALQKAKELVTFRRFSVLRKVLALIILLTVVFISIVYPSIFISAILAQILFYILVILAIPFATAYLFVLYRELL